MDEIIMLLCGIAPAALLIAYIRYRDRKNPEPWRMIVKGLMYGIISIPLALLFDAVMGPIPYSIGFGWLYDVPLLGSVFRAFYDAAIPEETAKLIMLWLLLRNAKDYDEYLDGVVYAVCISMGFAGLENILYIFQSDESWQGIAITRFIFAVPGHYIDAVLMGFFYSIVHFRPQKYGKYKSMILVVPILAHGFYDAICMMSTENTLFAVLSFILLPWFCIKMHKFCFKRIDKMDQLDESQSDLSTFTEAMRRMENRDDVNV